MVATRPLAAALTRPPLARVPVPGHQGLQIFGGRTETAVGGNATYEIAMELPARSPKAIGAVGVIAAQSRAATSPGSPGCFADVRALGALADLDGAWSGTAAITFAGGAGSAAQLLPAPSAARRTLLVSDMVEVVPKARTDGGQRPLVAARMFVGSGNLVLLGKSGDDFTPSAGRGAGLTRLRVAGTAGDQRAATSGWSATSTGPITGFSYAHLGPILNLVSIGDSQTDGRGEDYLSAGFAQRTVESLNADGPRTWLSHSNLAWSGQSTGQFVQNLRDLLRWGIVPDVLIFPIASINDMGATDPITAALVDTWRARVVQILALCAQARICPVAWTMPPCNASVRAWGASDALRLAYNAEMLAAFPAFGGTILDVAPAVTGAVDGNGQASLTPGFTSDGVHLNAAGLAVAAALARPVLQTLLSGYL